MPNATEHEDCHARHQCTFDLMRNEKRALEKLRYFKGYEFFINLLVYAEVMAGSQVRVKADTRKFLKEFKVMVFDAKAHITAVNFLYKYFTGRENKPMDLLIAAHAKALKISIITNNAKDFIFKEVTVFHYPKF